LSAPSPPRSRAPGGAVTATTPGAGPTTTATTVPTWQTTWTSAMDFYEGPRSMPQPVISPPWQSPARRAAQALQSVEREPDHVRRVTVGASAGAPPWSPHERPRHVRGPGRSPSAPANTSPVTPSRSSPSGPDVGGEHVGGGSSTVTVHYCCSGAVDSYATPNNAGNQTMDETGTPFTLASTHMRWLSAISVAGTPPSLRRGIRRFHHRRLPGRGRRLPVPLQRRIGSSRRRHRSRRQRGISGNTLTAFPASRPISPTH